MTSMTAIHGRASSDSTTSGRKRLATVAALEGQVCRLRRTLRRAPVLVMRRRVYNARMDNAVRLGLDVGAHTGKSSEVFGTSRPQRRPALRVVS